METGTKHAAPAADRRAFAGSVIVGRLRPEILRHILVPSRIHGRSIPELSMAFRGDMPFGPIMLDLPGFYQSPLYLYIRRRAGHGGLESGFCSREHHKLLPRSSSRFPPRKNPGRGGRSDRHRQTPGLTCPWQISSRNQVRDFRDRVRRDLVISTVAHHRITS